jgi:uncharacterized protein YecT (DUF1311 family)
MNKYFKFLASLMVAGITTATHADCSDSKTQLQMNECAAAQFSKLDKEMNAAYTAYRAQLDVEQERQFKAVQLAWLKLRDLTCKFESSGVEGGSVHPFILLSCLAGKTRLRLKEISVLASCAEGDLSCPVVR